MQKPGIDSTPPFNFHELVPASSVSAIPDAGIWLAYRDGVAFCVEDKAKLEKGRIGARFPIDRQPYGQNIEGMLELTVTDVIVVDDDPKSIEMLQDLTSETPTPMTSGVVQIGSRTFAIASMNRGPAKGYLIKVSDNVFITPDKLELMNKILDTLPEDIDKFVASRLRDLETSQATASEAGVASA